MNKLYITWNIVFERLKQIDQVGNIVYGIPKGGMIAAGYLSQAKITHDPHIANIIFDDIIDSGKTMEEYKARFPGKRYKALYDKTNKADYDIIKGRWIVFPWEMDHPQGEENIQDNITRQLQYIGEDPKREGLLKTPDRVVRMWDDVFKGYKGKAEEVFTTFDAGQCNQIVLLKNCELYSMCEHHMLPFFGKIHIAYIPTTKVIGVSKLARLAEIYSRRLQIQERIGDQITDDLMKHLQPLGAAVIIEATHMCMRMRGVEKQNSVMVTSSMRGAFLEKPEARMELMQLIKG